MSIFDDMYNDIDYEGIDLDAGFDMQAELKRFESYKPNPVQVLIRIYIQPKTTKGGLFIPPSSRGKDKFSNISGYVAKIGHACFSGEEFKHWGEWYKVGDWVAFPRHLGTRFEYDGLPVFTLTDHMVFGVIDDPRKV
jgi:co-chaperonin GroES (HSP10)